MASSSTDAVACFLDGKASVLFRKYMMPDRAGLKPIGPIALNWAPHIRGPHARV